MSDCKLSRNSGVAAVTLQSGDNFLYLAGPQILGDSMDPAIGLCRSLPVKQAGKPPSMFQSMPEIQDFATMHKQRGAVPDPFGSSRTITTIVSDPSHPNSRSCA